MVYEIDHSGRIKFNTGGDEVTKGKGGEPPGRRNNNTAIKGRLHLGK